MIVLLAISLSASPADGGGGAAVSQGPRQTFIAPSGEPFHAPGNAPYPVAQWFSGADKNGDGKLDFNEFETDFLRFFDQVDTDHDGAIDGGERMNYETMIAPETIGGTVAGKGSRGSGSGGKTYDKDSDTWVGNGDSGAARTVMGAARYDLLGLPEPVAAMDVRVRGRVSRNDAHEAAQLRFNQLDAAHRGYLTLDSLPRTFSQSGPATKRR